MPWPWHHCRICGTIRNAWSTLGFEMIPMRSMGGMQQELPVSLCAQDRALHQLRAEAQLFHGRLNTLARFLMQRGIAHDSTFADLSLADLELRFYEDDHLSLRLKHWHHGRNDHRNRYETHIKNSQTAWLRNIVRSEVPRV